MVGGIKEKSELASKKRLYSGQLEEGKETSK